MSKFNAEYDDLYEDGRDIATFTHMEDAARIVALLEQGDADRRRLDWLENNNVAIHDRSGSSQLIRFEIFRDHEIQVYGNTLREAIDAAIAAAPASKEPA